MGGGEVPPMGGGDAPAVWGCFSTISTQAQQPQNLKKGLRAFGRRILMPESFSSLGNLDFPLVL
jgi:hypothetical protein